MNIPRRVAVVIGSTRPGRISPGIAAWVRDALAGSSDLQYELLDLAEMDLPLLDEPLKAALHTYAHEHTKRWSARVESFDAFLFVFPQYNWGYPAVLKNALDYLYDEWRDKPAGTVTWGTRGGGRGAAQLVQVLQGLHMRVAGTRIEAAITDADVDAEWQLTDVDRVLGSCRPALLALDQEFTELLHDA